MRTNTKEVVAMWRQRNVSSLGSCTRYRSKNFASGTTYSLASSQLWISHISLHLPAECCLDTFHSAPSYFPRDDQVQADCVLLHPPAQCAYLRASYGLSLEYLVLTLAAQTFLLRCVISSLVEALSSRYVFRILWWETGNDVRFVWPKRELRIVTQFNAGFLSILWMLLFSC